MSPTHWVLAAMLGGLASVARFLVDGASSARAGRKFPYGTLLVNLSGAAALGVVTGLALGPDEATLVGTATIGSYTTFSTWMLETHRLHEDREFASAYANVLLSLFAGLGVAAAGRLIAQHL